MTTETHDSEHDPFAEFDAAAGIGTVRDPYPVWAELRAQTPVFAGPMSELFGIDSMDEALLQQPPYTPLTFDAVQQVLRDGETFSSSGYADTIGIVFGHSILEMDEPEHHAYRALIQQAFTRKAMETWEAEIVQPVVDRHIDAFRERGSADLVRELLFPFPVTVIGEMIGLPTDDLPVFHKKAVELISIMTDIEHGLNASAWLYEYFQGIITERRAAPRHDLISVLAQAELDGQQLSDDEIIAFLRLLLPAGAETTYRSSSNLMFGLLSNPDQLAALRDDRSLMPQAIEEGVRWDPPLTSIGRTCTKDTVVEGVLIPAGAPVMVCMAAANRDPSRWDRPDEFDIFREPKQHMSFAFGPHMCLGMHLARMETTVAVNALLDLPDLRLDPEAIDVHVSGLAFRAPSALPVVFG
ncbi:MAG: cytochrome P450 [Actinobacteria bacterium]|nr:cytochrome P450 [Actinomycetota bacterium]